MFPAITNEVRDSARVLWDYHCLDLGLNHTDIVLALGSHDERVATHAAQLIIQDYAPLLVTSGGLGKVTSETWTVTEGERFAQIAKILGVPESKIIVEETATNTGDNITKTRELLIAKGVRITSGILVTKPYMKRRAYATATRQWPEVKWFVSSPSLSFDDYPDTDVSIERMIELMVGDLQRIKVYADKGFQIPQDIPDEVWKCYEQLVEYGFDKFVIKTV